jgi:hypothetical protein
MEVGYSGQGGVNFVARQQVVQFSFRSIKDAQRAQASAPHAPASK